MALSKIKGYSILLDLNGSKIAGTTADTFNIAGVNEETLMKRDAGVKQVDNVSHEGKISVSAYVMKGSEAGWMNVTDVMDACAQNTEITFTLAFGSATSGNCKVTGTLMFSSFSINSDSEKYADMSIELESVGEITVTHYT